MTFNLRYISGKNGRLKAVQVPIREWEKLIQEYNHLKQIYKIKSDLTEATGEVREIKEGKRKSVLLKYFLNKLQDQHN